MSFLNTEPQEEMEFLKDWELLIQQYYVSPSFFSLYTLQGRKDI